MDTSRLRLTGIGEGFSTRVTTTLVGVDSPLRVMEALQLELSDRRLTDDVRLHPGRAATLVLEGRPLGCFGQLHPAMAEELDLPEATYMF